MSAVEIEALNELPTSNSIINFLDDGIFLFRLTRKPHIYTKVDSF